MYALHERLIPARAGNTSSILRVCYAVTAHPRSRGEHKAYANLETVVIGSSPLARGTLNLIVGRVMRQRLIPARAGNTTTCGHAKVV